MSNEKDLANIGASTIKDFLSQFGRPDDPSVHLLLEVLLEELYHAKIISLSREPEQTRDQSNNPSGGLFPNPGQGEQS